MNKITPALVITKPGRLRNRLQSIIRSVPQREMIAESPDPSVVLRMSAEIHPEYIEFNAEAIDKTDWAPISIIIGRWPKTRTLVLVKNDQQGQKTKAAGADQTLPKGISAKGLVKLIENSLIPNSRIDLSLQII